MEYTFLVNDSIRINVEAENIDQAREKVYDLIESKGSRVFTMKYIKKEQ